MWYMIYRNNWMISSQQFAWCVSWQATNSGTCIYKVKPCSMKPRADSKQDRWAFLSILLIPSEEEARDHPYHIYPNSQRVCFPASPLSDAVKPHAAVEKFQHLFHFTPQTVPTCQSRGTRALYGCMVAWKKRVTTRHSHVRDSDALSTIPVFKDE